MNLLKTELFLKACCISSLFIFLIPNTANAARVPAIFSFGGEKIVKIQDLPDTEILLTNDGEYIDAGCVFKQVSIFFIPLLNYDLQWCGYIGSNSSYIDLSEEELREISKDGNFKMVKKIKLPFWHAYGGKILLFVLIGGYLFISWAGKQE